MTNDAARQVLTRNGITLHPSTCGYRIHDNAGNGLRVVGPSAGQPLAAAVAAALAYIGAVQS